MNRRIPFDFLLIILATLQRLIFTGMSPGATE